MSLPFGFKGRDVHNDAAASIGRFAQADGQDAAGYSKIFDSSSQCERIRRDDAGITFDIHETVFVKCLRVHGCRVNVGEDLELI